MCFCCFWVFQENYPYAVKMNNFCSYSIPSLPPGSDQFGMFLTYVIEVDKREILRLYFKHIHVLFLLLVFVGKLPLRGKSEEFWVISII